jgi:hypothetical protein
VAGRYGRPIARAGPDVNKIAKQITRALEHDRLLIVKSALATAAEIHEIQLAKEAGSDMILSNVGKRHGKPGGVKVGVRVRSSRHGKYMAGGVIGATGPVGLLEEGNPRHIIRSSWIPKGGRAFIGPRVGGPRAILRLPDGGVRAWVQHPGTRGEFPFLKGKRRARPAITKIMRAQSSVSVRRQARLKL